jgi:hypothetical protein
MKGNMENFENISAKNLEKAYEIIRELQIENVWERFDSTCNLVGSLNCK